MELAPSTCGTYGYIVEVPFDLLGDLVGELAARYRQAVPGPVQCMNLPRGGQYLEG